MEANVVDTPASDLESVFVLLRSRSPESWYSHYEDRACELHQMFMTLKKFKTVEFIDPARKVAK